jgi:hypothetical protein
MLGCIIGVGCNLGVVRRLLRLRMVQLGLRLSVILLSVQARIILGEIQSLDRCVRRLLVMSSILCIRCIPPIRRCYGKRGLSCSGVLRLRRCRLPRSILSIRIIVSLGTGALCRNVVLHTTLVGAGLLVVRRGMRGPRSLRGSHSKSSIEQSSVAVYIGGGQRRLRKALSTLWSGPSDRRQAQGLKSIWACLYTGDWLLT